jgi:hypothetical protein
MPMPADLYPGLRRERLGTEPGIGYAKCMDAMYDLGRVNDAEFIAHETWEMVGAHPRVMKKLAFINIAKGQPEAAHAFLHALARDPVSAGWARAVLAALADDPTLAGDREVERLRRSRDVPDARDYLTEEQTLLDLLQADGRNRMAFDYLMAHYLLTRQLGKFIEELPRLRDFGDARLPRHYEEALELYRRLTLHAAEIPGYEVSPEARDRLEEFFGVLKAHGGDRESARLALVAQHRDSYPFYYVFAQSGGDR